MFKRGDLRGISVSHTFFKLCLSGSSLVYLCLFVLLISMSMHTQAVPPLSLRNTMKLKDPCSLLLHPSCWQKWIIPLSCSSRCVFSVFRKERRYFTFPVPVAVNVLNWRIEHHLKFTAALPALPGDALYMQTCQNIPPYTYLCIL